MDKKYPSLNRRRTKKLYEILQMVIEQQGRAILADLIRHKTGTPPAPSPSVPIWPALKKTALHLPAELGARWEAAKSEYRSLQTSRERGQFALFLGLKPPTFLGGFLWGTQIPDLDVRLRPRGGVKEAITVHAAPKLMTDLVLDWTHRVLELSRLSPELLPADKQILKGLAELCSRLQSGVGIGAAVRKNVGIRLAIRNLKHQERAVLLELPAYQMAEALLASLSDPGRRKDR